MNGGGGIGKWWSSRFLLQATHTLSAVHNKLTGEGIRIKQETQLHKLTKHGWILSLMLFSLITVCWVVTSWGQCQPTTC